MSTNIYEDQENVIPVQQRSRRIKENSVAAKPSKLSSLATKRSALSAININSNVRIQPNRLAKQAAAAGCSGESLDSSKGSKLKGQNLLLPSFSIHEDEESSVPSASSIGTATVAAGTSKPSETSSSAPDLATSSKPSSSLSSSTSLPSLATSVPNRPKLREFNLRNIICSPIKNKFKLKAALENRVKNANNKENEDPNAGTKIRSGGRTLPSIESPEDMDVSMCDGCSMVVDSPIVPREDLLRRREDEFWDVPEYAADVYNYLREAEVIHKPRPNYMQKQTDITASMRWILVDWLVEVSEEYCLHTETLYLAVSYIDRFLSHMSVKRDKLQLVGTTAIFIASKFEEIFPPDVSQFAYITDNTYRVGQILRMEHLILKVLSFDMAVPTAYLFANKFARMCKCSEETLHLALYISELTLLDSDPFLRYMPSLIAASSVALANYTQGKPVWPEEVGTETHYSLEDLRECYVNLYRTFCRVNDTQQHAIRDKYKSSKWSSVSNISPREGLPW